MYKISSTSTNQSQQLKQNTLKTSQKDSIPPINLSRQGPGKGNSSTTSKKSYDQNKNSQNNSSKSISKQSSLADDNNSRTTEEKIKSLISENSKLNIVLDEKQKELENLKMSYKNQYKEIMNKVDQMELFIQQQDKQNQQMVQDLIEKNEIIQQLKERLSQTEDMVEQERNKCSGYQDNFINIENHIGQVISENENLNILKDQNEAELKRKERELQEAQQRIEELEQEIELNDVNTQQSSDNPQQPSINKITKQNNQLKEEIRHLKNSLNDQQQFINELQEQINQCEIQISNYENLLQEKDVNSEQIKQIKEEQDNLDVNQQEIVKQKDEIIQSLMDRLSTQSCSALHAPDMIETEINKFKEEIQHNQLLIEQLNEENAELKYQLQQTQQNIASYQKYDTSSTQDQDENIILRSQINDLQMQLSKSENQILEQCEAQSNILIEKVNAEQTANHLKLQTETLRSELENLNSLIKSKRSYSEKSSQKLEEFRTQLKNITLENHEFIQKNAMLQSEVNNLKQQLQIANISQENAQKLADVRGEELSNIQNQIKGNLEQIENYKCQYQAALEHILKFKNNIEVN